MRVRFIRDFVGELAYEHRFVEGDEAEFPDDVAQHLIDKGRAVNADTGKGKPDLPPDVLSSTKPVDVGDEYQQVVPPPRVAEPKSEPAQEQAPAPKKGRR